MSKYIVNKQTYDNKDVEELGVMDINQIKNLAKSYIGDCMKDLEDVEKDIKYIIETGEETWLTNEKIGGEYIQIRIERKEE